MGFRTPPLVDSQSDNQSNDLDPEREMSLRLTERLRRILPGKWVDELQRWRRQAREKQRARLQPMSEDEFRGLLTGPLRLRPGTIAFVHSSLDALRLGFSPFRVLPILQEVVGPTGTLLFPTYPRLPSAEFLRSGQEFDLQTTPSHMGLLTELARRTPGAVRSLHPTKSVCALGPAAEELCSGHSQGQHPYGPSSPYRRFIDQGGFAIGLGVSSASMSFVHAVEDELRERFPVPVYGPELFSARCRDAAGELRTVETLAHNPAMMLHDVPAFLRRRIPHDIAEDLHVQGRSWFRADAARLFHVMVRLALEGVTMYPRSLVKKAA